MRGQGSSSMNARILLTEQSVRRKTRRLPSGPLRMARNRTWNRSAFTHCSRQPIQWLTTTKNYQSLMLPTFKAMNHEAPSMTTFCNLSGYILKYPSNITPMHINHAIKGLSQLKVSARLVQSQPLLQLLDGEECLARRRDRNA